MSKQDNGIEDIPQQSGSVLSADSEEEHAAGAAAEDASHAVTEDAGMAETMEEASSAVPDGEAMDISGDSSGGLEELLDDSAKFQEIDLFDEGIPDDINGSVEGPSEGMEDAAETHVSEPDTGEEPVSSVVRHDNSGELPDNSRLSEKEEPASQDAVNGPETEGIPEPDEIHVKDLDQPGSPEADHGSDDIGISLSDDELWEDSLDDNIPLFDNEPDTFPDSDAADIKVSPDRHDDTEGPSPEDNASVQEDIVPPAAQAETTAEGHVEEEQRHAGDEDVIMIGGVGPLWLPWALSGFFSCLLMGGVFILWGMLTSPGNAHSVQGAGPVASHHEVKGKSDGISSTVRRGGTGHAAKTAAGHDIPSMKTRPVSEALSLAPFIIPVQRQGELVFFKLTVELIVPDMQTKHALKKREAWVRDAIYTELKGIEVGPGTKGEFLQGYRRPLKKRIEKELAPLEIRDVRLMGYVLK